MIDVTLIGTAAAAPTPERALSCMALKCSGHTLLFDCGDGTQSALMKAHVSPMSLSAVCLTHFHGDHIFGLPGLLQSMGLHGRTQPLLLITPEEDGNLMQALMTLSDPLPFEVRRVLLPGGGLRLRDAIPSFPAAARLSPIATEHRVPSQGYRFTLERPGRFLAERAEALGVPQPLWKRLQRGESVEADGRLITPQEVLGEARRGLSVIYTGDTRPCQAIVEAARDADLLIMEATYAEDAQEERAVQYGHSTFSAAARLAAAAGARRLWLTHFSAMIDDPERYLPCARVHFPGAVAGQDGMRVTLCFES